RLSLVVFFFLSPQPPPESTLFPYTTLFRSRSARLYHPTRADGLDASRTPPHSRARRILCRSVGVTSCGSPRTPGRERPSADWSRSEERRVGKGGRARWSAAG